LTNNIKRITNNKILCLGLGVGRFIKNQGDFVWWLESIYYRNCLAYFLNQAIASLYEFVAILDLLLDSRYITNEDYCKFNKQAESIAKQISAFSKHLRQ